MRWSHNDESAFAENVVMKQRSWEAILIGHKTSFLCLRWHLFGWGIFLPRWTGFSTDEKNDSWLGALSLGILPRRQDRQISDGFLLFSFRNSYCIPLFDSLLFSSTKSSRMVSSAKCRQLAVGVASCCLCQ